MTCALALCGGCFTVDEAKLPGDPFGRHVFVRNAGSYLFDCVPIYCGNAREDASCGFVMFRNDVTLDKVKHRFNVECAKAGGGEVTDVVCHAEHNVLLSIPIWSFAIPIPYLWTQREIQISGSVH